MEVVAVGDIYLRSLEPGIVVAQLNAYGEVAFKEFQSVASLNGRQKVGE